MEVLGYCCGGVGRPLAIGAMLRLAGLVLLAGLAAVGEAANEYETGSAAHAVHAVCPTASPIAVAAKEPAAQVRHAA
jgi:hypothetical protein